MNLLTSQKFKYILNSLSKKTKAGIETPNKNNGALTPISGVFLCLSNVVAPLVRPNVLVVRDRPVSKPLWLHCPGLNLLRTTAQGLRLLRGGSYIQAMEPSK